MVSVQERTRTRTRTRICRNECGAPSPADGNVTHFCLYLNVDTFVGKAGARLADEVRAALATNQTIVMPHENDPAKGGCDFERFFTTTPPDIIAAGWRM